MRSSNKWNLLIQKPEVSRFDEFNKIDHLMFLIKSVWMRSWLCWCSWSNRLWSTNKISIIDSVLILESIIEYVVVYALPCLIQCN